MSYMSYLLLLLVFIIFSYLIRLLWIRFTINRRLQEQTRNGQRQHTPHVPYFIRVRDMISAQQEQERSTRQQAAECPPKYEDVFDAPGGRGHAQAHNQALGAHAHGALAHGQPFSTSYRRASDPGGLANPGFTEEPPPDYSSAVASTQNGNLSEESMTNLPYQLASVHRTPYPAANNYSSSAVNNLPYPLADGQPFPRGNNSSDSPGDNSSQQRF